MRVEEIREPLAAFLRGALGDPALRVDRLDAVPEGHSGFTYFVDAGPRSFVLRLPPPGARIAGPADVVRQGRIMRALGAAGLPVPAVPFLCDDASVLDGRPFILMDRVDSSSFKDAVRAHGSPAIARATVECLERLHAVPLGSTGIGDEPPRLLADEVTRWSELMKRGVTELTTGATELDAALRTLEPTAQAPALVHGDYHYGNLLFDGSRVAAILDWEIAQVGQPLLDLASLCVIAERRRFPDDPNPGGIVETTSDDLIRLYGADRELMRWYVALGCYKYAAIFAYNLGLHRRGKRIDPHYEKLAGTITGLLARGRALLS
jgi:aminoglycoside phosphotransferase (APT) family kinase protein